MTRVAFSRISRSKYYNYPNARKVTVSHCRDSIEVKTSFLFVFRMSLIHCFFKRMVGTSLKDSTVPFHNLTATN